MANTEQLEILKKGVETWNEWREENSEVVANLSDVNLSCAHLTGANLYRADFTGAKLIGADLTGADLGDANLLDANLRDAFLRSTNLRGANLYRADFTGANLSDADLTGADLGDADLTGADLTGTFLTGANLTGANLTGANLTGAELTGAFLDYAVFGKTNLREAKNLDQCYHAGPSVIDQMTLVKSGKLPESFLRGCGLSDEFIQYIPSLFWNPEPFQFYSCFISYSSRDEDFAKRLHADLQSEGVRCWFAPEDMKIGDKIRQRIDESIRIYDKLLLILSKNSINSTWVEKEVETAFEKEQRNNHLVLFPIRLDNGVMGTDTSWAADIRRTRHIGDFTNWKDHDSYQAGFKRLLRDLRGDGKTGII